MFPVTVSQWYSGKEIFITGSSGFMGKVLVEKLLRSCNVQKVYLLIRPKKGLTAVQRIQIFTQTPLFDKLRELPNADSYFNKLVCVSGDVMEENLGISEVDLQELIQKVNVVFHMAANVKFQQPLKNAVLMNVGGTVRVLDIAKQFEKLVAFAHISTAYCQCGESVLLEKILPAPHNPRRILRLLSLLGDKDVVALTPHLIAEYPNTYAYTKCLTEQIVVEYSSDIRIVILRPSIVTATYNEPIPGWVDNFNGPTGLLVGCGKGLIRSLLCDESSIADLVPVDITINRMLVVTKQLTENKQTEVAQVVNLTADSSNPITWRELFETGEKHFYSNPFSLMLWYPNATITSSRFWYTISLIFFHYLPAYVIDFLMRCIGLQPFLVRTQNKISRGMEILYYYSRKPWIFKNEKLAAICMNMTQDDKDTFNCDMRRIDWNNYILDYVLGARKYRMGEGPETLPEARKILKRLYILDWISKIAFLTLFVAGAFYIMPYIIYFSMVFFHLY